MKILQKAIVQEQGISKQGFSTGSQQPMGKGEDKENGIYPAIFCENIFFIIDINMNNLI